jgi:predicted nucleic acid-binding protein
LLNDNDELSPKAKHVMDMADKGEITLLVSVITIAEVVWVLESFYEIAKSQIADTFVGICVIDRYRM